MVTAQGSYTRERLRKAVAPTPDRDLELYEAGFDATWELDFFGRVRRTIEASAADVGAAEANRRDVIVGISANLLYGFGHVNLQKSGIEIVLLDSEGDEGAIVVKISMTSMAGEAARMQRREHAAAHTI